LSEGGAVTAAAGDLGLAVGVLADELALGLGAFGLGALPVASGLLADGLALGFGGLGLRSNLAVGHAVRLLADGHTFGAVLGFARLVRAFDLP